jgi:hypothetical protein
MPRLTIAASIFGISCLFGKVMCQVKAESPLVDMDVVTASLKVIHRLVMDQKKLVADGEDHLRLCVYTKLPDRDALQIITPQIGDSGETSELPEIDASIGLVGKTYRTGQAWHSTAKTGENLADFLVSNWGFPRNMAQLVRSDRRSLYGIPLKGSSTMCFGVLFCDSCDTKFFGKSDDQDTPRRKMLRSSSIPIAEALKAAYHSRTKTE